MEKGEAEDALSNVPHMRLFVELKHKFPELKDADITECIQRFGLHREKCEAELSQRMREQQRGYYSPWNQSRTSSRPSSVSRTSPLSDGQTFQNGIGFYSPRSSVSSPEAAQSRRPNNLSLSIHPAEPISSYSATLTNELNPIYSNSASPTIATTASHYQPSLANNNCPSRNHPLPNSESAPVICADRDPFASYDPTSNRRSSAETEMERRVRLSPNIATIHEQASRKEKLEEELKRRMDEKFKLIEEVKSLSNELEAKEKYQRDDVERSKKKMESIRQENSRLHFQCQEIKREIIENGGVVRAEPEKRIIQSRNPPVVPPYSPLDSALPISTSITKYSTSGYSRPAASPSTPVGHRRPAPIPLPTNRRVEPSPRLSHPVEDRERGWSCSQCTFINSSYLNQCEICSNHFPSEAPPPPVVAHAGPPNAGGPCYCHQRHHHQYDHQSSVKHPD